MLRGVFCRNQNSIVKLLVKPFENRALYITDGPLTKNIVTLTLIQYDMTIKEMDDLMCNVYPTKFFQTMVYMFKLHLYQQKFFLLQNRVDYHHFLENNNETYLVLKTEPNVLQILTTIYKQYFYLSMTDLLLKLEKACHSKLSKCICKCCGN